MSNLAPAQAAAKIYHYRDELTQNAKFKQAAGDLLIRVYTDVRAERIDHATATDMLLGGMDYLSGYFDQV